MKKNDGSNTYTKALEYATGLAVDLICYWIVRSFNINFENKYEIVLYILDFKEKNILTIKEGYCSYKQ